MMCNRDASKHSDLSTSHDRTRCSIVGSKRFMHSGLTHAIVKQLLPARPDVHPVRSVLRALRAQQPTWCRSCEAHKMETYVLPCTRFGKGNEGRTQARAAEQRHDALPAFYARQLAAIATSTLRCPALGAARLPDTAQRSARIGRGKVK